MGDLLRFRPRQEPADREFDVCELITEVCAKFESQMTKGLVDVEIDAPPYTMIATDRETLRQVLEHLIGQAVRMTPPKREIVVTVFNEADGLDVEIADGSAIFARELDQVDPAAVSALLDSDPQIQAASRMITALAGSLDVVECADGAVAFNVHLPRAGEVEKDSRKAA